MGIASKPLSSDGTINGTTKSDFNLQPIELDHGQGPPSRQRVPPFEPRGKEWLLWRFVRLRLAIAGIFYKRVPGARTARLGPRSVLKRGWDVWEAEAKAMRFVAANTTIPVPKVFRTYKICGRVYIEMEYIKGESPTAVWDKLSPIQQRSLMAELEEYVRQLRALPPPLPEAVCAVDGSPCADHRIGIYRAGPFKAHDHFHKYLRFGTDLDVWMHDDLKVVADSHCQSYASKFTHGDLAPRNVLVRDGRIAAVIDWDSAGWRPEYWEISKAYFTPLGVPSEWFDALKRAAGKDYGLQVEAEQRLWRGEVFPSSPAKYN